MTAGTNLTTPEAGAIEWNGTNLFVTNSSNVRRTVNQGITANATLNFPPTPSNSFNSFQVTVPGAVPGDVVSLGIPDSSAQDEIGIFSAWVQANDIVKIRFNNYSSTTLDPNSGTFGIFVTKF